MPIQRTAKVTSNVPVTGCDTTFVSRSRDFFLDISPHLWYITLMDELIKAFVAGGGIDMTIDKEDKLLWLSYLNLSLEERKTLEHIGFVFTKHTRKSPVLVSTEVVKPFLFFFTRKETVLEIKHEVEEIIVMRAREPKTTLEGK